MSIICQSFYKDIENQHGSNVLVQLVNKDMVHKSVIETLLIGVEGAQTAAGSS